MAGKYYLMLPDSRYDCSMLHTYLTHSLTNASRCYDTCTTAPPIESPPCSLPVTTIESSYVTSIPTPAPGSAYTKNPATDDIAPAIDDSKAMVMAEMPASSSPTPSGASPAAIPDPASQAGELRVAQAQNVVEAPSTGGSMRGNAILKMEANTDRVPNTENVPCWDKPSCKEVQLGIPNPNASAAPAESAASTDTAASETPSASDAAATPADTAASDDSTVALEASA